jgi:hypothetical protein
MEVVAMKFLNPKIHAYLDYALAIALALSPMLFEFIGTARILCYALAAAILVLSLLTRYPLGVIRAIPFKIHGYIELAAGLFTLAAPWIFNFEGIDLARNLFIGVGVLVVALFVVTDYEATEPAEARKAAKGAA